MDDAKQPNNRLVADFSSSHCCPMPIDKNSEYTTRRHCRIATLSNPYRSCLYVVHVTVVDGTSFTFDTNCKCRRFFAISDGALTIMCVYINNDWLLLAAAADGRPDDFSTFMIITVLTFARSCFTDRSSGMDNAAMLHTQNDVECALIGCGDVTGLKTIWHQCRKIVGKQKNQTKWTKNLNRRKKRSIGDGGFIYVM